MGYFILSHPVCDFQQNNQSRAWPLLYSYTWGQQILLLLLSETNSIWVIGGNVFHCVTVPEHLIKRYLHVYYISFVCCRYHSRVIGWEVSFKVSWVLQGELSWRGWRCDSVGCVLTSKVKCAMLLRGIGWVLIFFSLRSWSPQVWDTINCVRRGLCRASLLFGQYQIILLIEIDTLCEQLVRSLYVKWSSGSVC